MAETREGSLPVPGANLYYKVQGAGPLLLLLQGGASDAEGSDALAKHLVDHYQIVTYDRRGLSRSKLNESAEPPSIETHTDDAHRLLAALTSEPALVVGFSIGALIGLDLAARYPQQVARLISHEPGAARLLSEDERLRSMQVHEEVQQIYRREGLAAAMKKMVAISGVRFDDREPDVELPQPSGPRAASMAANLNFFLTHDAPFAHQYELDMTLLQAAADRIVVAAGRTSGETMPRRSAMALAERLGTQIVEFPGGHSGYALRPREFASRLREVLASSMPSPDP
jgi:pimeloyl-ACP methyl ester carboxylesterase